MTTIGQRIKWARRQVEISGDGASFGQGKLALACGWPRTARQRISNYETDEREPSLDDIRLLAAALNVSPSWLAFGEIPGARLSTDEREMLIAYRSAPPERRNALLALLQTMPPAANGKAPATSAAADPRIVRKVPRHK